MPKLSRRLERLEKELLGLGGDAMLADELDGFVAGLLVCPELIAPSEWLPVVWGSEDDEGPGFDGLDHMNRVISLVIEHYNEVAGTLIERPDRYAPLFAVDRRNDDIIWETWIAGFDKALKLRPGAWKPFLDADPQTAEALAGLITLADVDRRDPRFSEEQLHSWTALAPDAIGPWVVALNRWRLAHGGISPAPPSRPRYSTPGAKVGRNDPCLCGSGKKYKKCCGLN